jgi:hypothetical protein
VTTLDDFVVLAGDGTGSATPAGDGFALHGGPYGDFASGVRLFSRFALPASGTVRYRLTRLSVPRTVTAEGAWFNVGVVWGRDPAALPADTPTGDIATAGMWTGWRITHANRAAKDTSSNRLRLATYPGRSRPAPREAGALANFRRGVANEVVLTWRGNVVSLAVPTMGATVKQSWSNAALKVPATGARLMFYGSFGGGWLVEGVAVAARGGS